MKAAERRTITPTTRCTLSQIGAAFVGTDPDESIAPIVTRVPAGLSCYLPGAGTSGSATYSGAAAAPLVLPDDSVSCSFGLTSCIAGSVFSLADLQLKPRAGAAAHSSPATAATTAASNNMLYAVEWTTVEAAVPPLSFALPGRTALAQWSLTLDTAFGSPAAATQRHTAGHAVKTVARQVQALQSALQSGQVHPGVRAAMTVRGLPEGCVTSPAAARLSAAPRSIALMRVAAQEAPTVVWTTCASDAAAACPAPAPAVADSFAVASSGGAWLAPRLIAHVNASSTAAASSLRALPLDPAAAFRGTVLVSGGLGDIGLLAAQWVAATAPAARLVLLSRSGHSDRVAALASQLRFAAGVPAVTVARCDVASRDEMEGLVAHLAAAGGTVDCACIRPLYFEKLQENVPCLLR